jgi:hypothetical protein
LFLYVEHASIGGLNIQSRASASKRKQMTRIFKMIQAVPILGLFLLTNSLNAQSKELLLGQWAFEKFAYPDLKMPEKQLLDANKANKGLTVTFTTDNKYASNQPNGLRQNNTTTWYKLLGDQKHLVIGGDTVLIKTLDSKHLQLYHDENRPDVYFTKIK